MSKKFLIPTSKQRAKALGDTYRLNDDIRRAVTIEINECFPLIPEPEDDDWLNIHEESGQTVQQFEEILQPLIYPRIIFIQPIGSFNHLRSPSVSIICNFAEYFFPGCQFEILPQIDFNDFLKPNQQKGFRINSYTQKVQYLTTNIISYLKKLRYDRQQWEKNSYELFSIGITMEDIYSEPDDNFVYGIASINDKIGIYSFARLDPLFPNIPKDKSVSEDENRLILKRSISIFIHEIYHLFGLQHCIYYLCLMNGAEHEDEMDKQPLYLCPICLRKSYELFGKEKKNFNIKEIYTNILNWCKKLQFQEEIQWYENRLKILT